MMKTQGLLLVAHGARDPRWAEPFEAIVAKVHEWQPRTVVALGYLDLMAPNVTEAGSSLAALGCASIDVVPLFLGAGGHVRHDLPALIERLREQHPGAQWTLRAAIGEHPAVIEAMARAIVGSPGIVDT